MRFFLFFQIHKLMIIEMSKKGERKFFTPLVAFSIFPYKVVNRERGSATQYKLSVYARLQGGSQDEIIIKSIARVFLQLWLINFNRKRVNAMYVKLVLMTFKKCRKDRNLITGTKDPHLYQLKFFFLRLLSFQGFWHSSQLVHNSNFPSILCWRRKIVQLRNEPRNILSNQWASVARLWVESCMSIIILSILQHNSLYSFSTRHIFMHRVKTIRSRVTAATAVHKLLATSSTIITVAR